MTAKPGARRPPKKSAWEQYRLLIIVGVAGLALLVCLSAVVGGLYINSLNQAQPTLASVIGTPLNGTSAPPAGTGSAPAGTPNAVDGAAVQQTGTAAGAAASAAASSAASGAGQPTATPKVKPTFTGTPTSSNGELPTFTPYASETTVPTITRAPATETPTDTPTAAPGTDSSLPTVAPTLIATRKVG